MITRKAMINLDTFWLIVLSKIRVHAVQIVSCNHESEVETSFSCAGNGPHMLRKKSIFQMLTGIGWRDDRRASDNIIWCYGIYQPAYDDMSTCIPNITFVQGVPSDLESIIGPSIRNLVVIDDLMQELSNDQGITNLFTKGCCHCNLSVIFIIQNIFLHLLPTPPSSSSPVKKQRRVASPRPQAVRWLRL